MEIHPAFASPYGLYCGVCAICIAHRDNNHKFKERLAELYHGRVPGKGTLPNGEHLSAEDIRCRGCLSGDRFMHCKQCAIRVCTRKKGYEGCHQCGEFPCRHIETFSDDGREKRDAARGAVQTKIRHRKMDSR